MLDDYLAKERSQGQLVGGESSFTLEPQKVRERVATFCEEQSLYPLLRCFQAIVACCHGDIFIQQQEKSWNLNFNWPGCPPTSAFADLVNLGVTVGFDSVGHRAGQHLFFGLSAAIGTKGYELEWRSPQACFLVKDGEFLATEPVAQAFHSLRFSVAGSWWQKLLDQRRAERLAEEFKRLVVYSPKPVHLNQELLVPTRPQAPEKPWATRFIAGSDLAWRFLNHREKNLLTIPYPQLDYYRCNKEGTAFHLVKEPGVTPLPLSVAFNAQGAESSLSASRQAYCALFLSLETGRQDWLIPISDGVATSPIPVSLSGGGVLALTSEPSLQYDLSGLKVVENANFESHLAYLKKEAKALKKQLALSVANVSVRSSKLPHQYDQALSYLVGGPYAGFLGARIGPKIRRFFTRSETSHD